jgi:teichoic acid ribitol-phosphate primase
VWAVKRLLVLVRLLAVRLGFLLGRLRPVDRDILLATAHGARISGNLEVLSQELARRGIAPVRTTAYTPSRTLRGRVRALLGSVVAGYRLARARLLVIDDYFFPLYAVRPRAGTTVVQTWHACGALKKFGYSVLDKTFGADEALVNRVSIHSNYDVCLVSSRAAVPFYAEAFRQPPEIFVSDIGIPRTDLLVDGTRAASAADAVRRQYALADGKRVVLYAPTFRGDRIADARTSAALDLGLLGASLADDHIVLLRLHPFVRGRLAIPAGLRGFVIDASDHPDINELMVASDVLVTDYSSAVFEFALLGRPIALFAPDYEAYERERGFYIDYRSSMPGPIFESTAPLAAYLRAGRFDLERVARFARTWFDAADGQATNRFVDRIVVPALAEANR